MDNIIKDARSRMDKTLEALRSELVKVRTGKATTALLDGIKVDYYGTMTPLNQVGNVTVLDAHVRLDQTRGFHSLSTGIRRNPRWWSS